MFLTSIVVGYLGFDNWARTTTLMYIQTLYNWLTIKNKFKYQKKKNTDLFQRANLASKWGGRAASRTWAPPIIPFLVQEDFGRVLPRFLVAEGGDGEKRFLEVVAAPETNRRPDGDVIRIQTFFLRHFAT